MVIMEASHSHRANGAASRSRLQGAERMPAAALAPAAASDWPSEVIILCAGDREGLIRQIDRLLIEIRKHSSSRLADLGFTLNSLVEPGGVRLAVVAGDLAELSQKLSAARQQLSRGDCQRIRDPSGTYFEARPLLASGKLAILFPGEGGQYQGMLSELVPHFPEVRTTLAEADAAFGPDGGDTDSISRFFQAAGQLEPARRQRLEDRLRQIDWTMASVLTADTVLARMLENLGVKADALGGHSAGELAALVAARCMKLTTDMLVIAAALRDEGETERTTEQPEALLLATAGSRETLTKLIAEVVPEAAGPGSRQSVFIAMDNCPHQTVVVGLPEPMLRVEAAVKSRGIFCERLPFTRPYHTPLFALFKGQWREMFDTVDVDLPQYRLYSCTTGQPFPADPDAIRELATAHWFSPVEFRRMIENMYSDGVRVFVEAGPKGILSAFVQDILRGHDCLALPADQSRRSALTQWNHLVAQLAVHLAPMDLGFMYRYRTVDRLAWQSELAPQEPVRPTRQNARTQDAVERAAATASPATATPAQPAVKAPRSVGERPPTPAAVLARHFQLMETLLENQQQALASFLRAKSAPAVRVAKPLKHGRKPGRSIPPIAKAAPPAAARPSQPNVPIAAPKPSQRPADGELPLFGTIVKQDGDAELVMQRRLDLSEDLYANEHTVGGLDISRLNPKQRGLPVMPMTFILEMMAETAARLVPGHVVIAARDVQLQKWLAFDEESVSTVEVSARRTSPAGADGPVEVLVSVRDLGRATNANRAAAAAVSQGTIVLARQYPPAPHVEEFALSREQPCRVTLATLYRNLFHGPMFQGVRSLDCFGEEGLKGSIEVLPREGIFRSTASPRFLIDPVTVDVGMHPTAGWHLEQPDQAGRIMLPFELKRIEFFGPSPAVGTKFGIHARIVHTSPRQFTHAGEFFGSDGRLWCRLTGIKCWRFYLPFGDVNFHGPKDEYFISQQWPLGLPSAGAAENERAVCVLLDPSGDLAQSGMQEAAARVTLSETEMRDYRQQRVATEERTSWLFARAAVKDAVRFLWHRHTGSRLFMADLEIFEDPYGRSAIRFGDGQRPADFPAIAAAQHGATFVALAVLGPYAGIAVERIAGDEAAEQGSSGGSFTQSERAVLAQFAGQPSEQIARGVAARAALRRALGPALIPDDDLLRIRAADAETGYLYLELEASLQAVFPDLVGSTLPVRTVVNDGAVIASTSGPVPGGRG